MRCSALTCFVLVVLASSVTEAQSEGENESIPVCDDGSRWHSELQICVDESPPEPRVEPEAPDERRECERLWARAEQQQHDGRPRDAADTLVELYTDHREICVRFGEHDLCEVLYRAGSLYKQDGRIGPAIQLWRRLINECGDGAEYADAGGEASPWAIEGVLMTAQAYERIAAYTKAASYYVELGRRYPHHSKAAMALAKAARLRMALGQDEMAIEAARIMERHFAKQEEHRAAVASLQFDLGEIFLRRHSSLAAIESHYSAFLRKYRRVAQPVEVIDAMTHVGEMMSKRGPLLHKASQRVLERAVLLAEQSLKNREASDVVRLKAAGARARFVLAQVALNQLVEISIPAPPTLATDPGDTTLGFYWVEERYVPWLEKVGLELTDVVTRFSTVATSGSPEWEVAAMARSGQAYRVVAETMSKAPPGSHDMALDVLSQRGYDVSSTDIVSPDLCRDRAIDLFTRCLDVARSHRIMSSWTRICSLELSRLDPGSPQDDELVAEPSLIPEMLAQPKMVEVLPRRSRR